MDSNTEDPWDNPWDDNPKTIANSEWSKISSDFQNAGYREGITAGKESALQEGFDQGFAQTGAPLGREIGFLRGISAALVALLSSTLPISPTASSNAAAVAKSQSLPIAETRESLLQEAKQISSLLNDIRFSDIVPPDLEAEQHAREHLQSTNDDDNDDIDIDLGEEISHKRGMENLEDMLTRMSAGNSSTDTAMKKGRPTMEDVRSLSDRLSVLAGVVGLSLPQLS